MRKATFLLIISLTLWGCATFSPSYKSGTAAAINKDWDAAIEHFEKASLADPDNSVYRLALLRARLSASAVHLRMARDLVYQDKREEAQNEYRIALSYDPTNWRILDEARRMRSEETAAEEETPRMEPPVKLHVADEKVQLKFTREASLQSIFQALGKHAGVNVLFDEQFRDKPFAVDFTDMDFEQAVGSLCMASKNFYRVIDAKTIIIIPDQPMLRAKYDLTVIKTFYLSNIDAQEILGSLSTMTRTAMKAPSIIVDKNLNSVTVRDTPAVVELVEKLVRMWDKPKGEVVLDLEIMEVSRIKMRDLGLDLSEYGVGMQYNDSGTEEESTGLIDLNRLDFSKAENFQISLPASILRFMESDGDTKIISQPRIRGVEGEKMEYLVGDQIPIPRTTFTPIAAGGVSQQPITSFEYKDVGIDVKITPRIHFENEVTLELEIKIMSLGGTGYADIPIISTREIKNIIRLRDGETNLLAGLLKDEERRTVKGFAGVKSIPVLGSLFSRTDQEIQQTDVILTITPHIIRKIPLGEEDRKPVWVNLEGANAGDSRAALPEDEMLSVRLRQERLLEDRDQLRRESMTNRVYFNPVNFEGPAGRDFRINVNLRSDDEIGSMSVNLAFNPRILELKEVVEGGFVQQFGSNPSFLKSIDNGAGTCTLGFSSPEVDRGFKGQGRVATLIFHSLEKGESPLSITMVTANAPSGQAVVLEKREVTINIK